LKQRGFSGHIVGHARRQQTLDDAVAAGCIDSSESDAVKAVEGADLVMLTIPMQACRALLGQIAAALGRDTIVTDGGSVKGSFIDDARATLAHLDHVVPGHPIVGREKSGVAAAQADLYQDKRVLLTPLPETTNASVATVTELWQMTGAVVECLAADHHDRVLAATSHLPHILAFGLVDLLAAKHEHEEIFRYAAGGFRDFTRIASGDPVMWRDICLTNKKELLNVMDAYQLQLNDLRAMIDQGDGDTIEALFSRSKAARAAHGLVLDGQKTAVAHSRKSASPNPDPPNS